LLPDHSHIQYILYQTDQSYISLT